MGKDTTASPSRVKDNNTVLYPPNVAVKEFCCFVVTESSTDFAFLSITWIDAHYDAVFCLTHLFSRQGQRLHERLLLIQPSHIHAQKYHKEWFLLSSKQSGQQGSSSNWRTTSHLLYCTFTQKKKEMGDSVSVFLFLHFSRYSFLLRFGFVSSKVRSLQSPSQPASCLLRWETRRSEKERRRAGRSERNWDVKRKWGRSEKESGREEEEERCFQKVVKEERKGH